MKVLIVGGGGREHALALKITQSPQVHEVHCAPGNAGIAAQGIHCQPIKATDIDGILSYAQQQSFGLVVVAPDDPLVMGLVDQLEAAGIPAFGPSKAAAAIEGSKVFAKELMLRYGIPTAQYKSFSNLPEATEYVQQNKHWPLVVKADGLALGKGVVIAQGLQEAEDAVRKMMQEKVFGESGVKIVVEKHLSGPEVSVLAFCDGQTVIPMPSAMDHKKAFDGNIGPNTGGMGAVAPNPHYTPEIAKRCMREIFEPTVRALREEGRPFKGCLYFGLMITESGPMVIEYNCRFGDPEAQVILPLLETDLVEIMLAVRAGKLDQVDIKWRAGAAACVVMASQGYPGPYTPGKPISGLDETGQLPKGDGTVYHAGTRRDESGQLVTAGGRVLGITALGADLQKATQAAYAAAKSIGFEGMQLRSDIGKT